MPQFMIVLILYINLFIFFIFFIYLFIYLFFDKKIMSIFEGYRAFKELVGKKKKKKKKKKKTYLAFARNFEIWLSEDFLCLLFRMLKYHISINTATGKPIVLGLITLSQCQC